MSWLIAIITVNGVGHCWYLKCIYKIYLEEINIKNRVYNYHFNILIRSKKLGTKNIVIDGKNYNDLVIYLLDMIIGSWWKCWWTKKIEKHKEQKYLLTHGLINKNRNL